MDTRSLEAARQAFQTESECLAEAFSHIDPAAFSRAVDVLAKAERIGTIGCGHSGIACRHLAHLLCCIERPARFISPAEAIHGGMGFLQKGDVAVLASRGGKTAELLPIIEICEKKGIVMIAVTENMSSPLAVQADIVLRMYVSHEVDPENCQGTTSFTMTAALFHSLQAAIILETGYTSGQFAVIHPGGAVGERLNRPGRPSTSNEE